MTDFENDQLVKRAISHLRLGNASEAKRILSACVKKNPEDINAWLGPGKNVLTMMKECGFCLDKVLDAGCSKWRSEGGAAAAMQGGKEPFPELAAYYHRREERSKPKPVSASRPQRERRSIDIQKIVKERRNIALVCRSNHFVF